MITKQEVVEMLANNNDIMNYEKFKTEFKSWKDSLSQFIHIFLRCIIAHEIIIERILAKLDETDTPTETTST